MAEKNLRSLSTRDINTNAEALSENAEDLRTIAYLCGLDSLTSIAAQIDAIAAELRAEVFTR